MLAGDESGDNWLASTCVQRPVSPTMGHSSYCELHSTPLLLELWSCETAASGSGVVKLLPVTSVVCAAAGRNEGFTVYRRGEEKLMGTGSAILRWNIDNHSTVTINSVETARNVALSMILNILHRLMIRHGSYYATGQHYCLVTAFLFLLCITTPPSRIMNIMQARAAAAMRAMRVVVG